MYWRSEDTDSEQTATSDETEGEDENEIKSSVHENQIPDELELDIPWVEEEPPMLPYSRKNRNDIIDIFNAFDTELPRNPTPRL